MGGIRNYYEAILRYFYHMDIILCATSDLSYDQRMQRIAGSLADAGYRVLLVGREKSDSPELPTQGYAQHRFRMKFQAGKLFYLEYNLRLLLFLLRQKSKAIGAVDLDTLLPCYLVSRWQKRKLVYDAHEYFTETPEVERRPHIKRIWETLAAWLVPKVDAAYTVGPKLAEVMGQRYGVAFGLVRNVPMLAGEAVPTSDVISTPDAPIILYQGVLNEGRGLEAMIAAMPLIPHATLWLAGEGDRSDALRQLAADSPAGDRIRFLGYQLPAALKKITPQAALGINLLEDRGLSYHYSLANKVFDYTQAGVPCLTMDFPEYRALHEQYGIFLLLDDLAPERIAELVTAFLANTAKKERARRACLTAAATLNWEQEAQGLLEIWKEVLA